MGVSFDTTSATIVVPIMAASLEDVALQWEAAVGAGADIVEWRIDALEPQLWDAETVGESGALLRAQFGTPVLADACRTGHSDWIDVAGNLHGRAYSAARGVLPLFRQ